MSDAATAPNVAETPSKVAETASKVGQSVKDVFSKISNSPTTVIIFAIVAIFVVMIVAYLIYSRLIVGLSGGNKGIILTESKVPIIGTVITQLDGKEIQASGNGQRQTIAFWIYINDIDKFKGVYRHVLHRGDKVITNASPLIFIDKDTNKMHVRFDKEGQALASTTMDTPFDTKLFATTSSRPATITTTEFKNILISTTTPATYVTKQKLDMMKHGITIDYLPTRRWIHVAVVVNDQASKGSISAYIDGELVKVVDSSMTESIILAGTTVTKVKYDFTNLVLDKGGNVYTGGASSDSLGPGFDGAISKIQFFNYDLNTKDIYKVYMQGPIDSLMTKAGLAPYGIRNPVYRLG